MRGVAHRFTDWDNDFPNFFIMETSESEIKNIRIEVESGPGGESGDVYAWIDTPLPPWAKTVDDPTYRQLSSEALEAAKNLVRNTGERVRLSLKSVHLNDREIDRVLSFRCQDESQLPLPLKGRLP
jgi:hypothetical protein